MFDTVNGLPVHALVVHAVVVLVPLMALVTLAVSVRAAWRRHAGWVVAANTVVLALAVVATQSGEALQARLARLSGQPVAQDHAGQGELVPWFAAGLVVAALVVLAARRGGVLVPLGIAAAALAGVGALGWVVVVGESGAASVWRDTIANTTAP